MIDIVDEVPYQHQPKCIEAAKKESFGTGEFLKPFRVVSNEIIHRFGNETKEHRKDEGEADEINDLFFNGFVEHFQEENAKPHDMRNEQSEYTGEDQADEIGFRRLAESRHKKYAYRNIYRPPDDLAPPIS